MTTQLDEKTDLNTDTLLDDDDPILSHIIERDDKQSAHARITEARVNGTAVTALCGYVWVPSRNPENHPVCQKCLEIFEFAKQFRS